MKQLGLDLGADRWGGAVAPLLNHDDCQCLDWTYERGRGPHGDDRDPAALERSPGATPTPGTTDG